MSLLLQPIAGVKADGSPTQLNSVTSPVWAGFIMKNGHTPNITDITGSWVVPSVACSRSETSLSSTWVGLGGDYLSFYQDALSKLIRLHLPLSLINEERLYQTGTDSDCVNGVARYSAWEEVYSLQHPNTETVLKDQGTPYPVAAGDLIDASVSTGPGHSARYSVSASLNGHQLWSYSNVWSTKVQGDHTAECVVEDPLTGSGIAAFTDFGAVRFSQCSIGNGTESYPLVDTAANALPKNWTGYELTMKRGKSILATPDASNLSVTWGDGKLPNGSRIIAWGEPTHIDSAGATLGGVSCASATFCVAVDSEGNAFTFNGSSWSQPARIDPNGGGLFRVACPSKVLCIAIDHAGNVVTFNGAFWTTPQQVDQFGALNRISCPMSTFCMVVDDSGYALSFNGTTWSQPNSIDPNGVDDSALGLDNLAVSCASATQCLAVDGGGNVLTFNGYSWTMPSSLDTTAGLLDISCTPTDFCVATDFDGDALVYANGDWSMPTPITNHGSGVSTSYGGSGYDLGSLFASCITAEHCTAVDAAGDAITLQGGRWSLPVNIDATDASLSGISCPDVSMCVAIDESGNALVGRAA